VADQVATVRRVRHAERGVDVDQGRLVPRLTAACTTAAARASCASPWRVVVSHGVILQQVTGPCQQTEFSATPLPTAADTAAAAATPQLAIPYYTQETRVEVDQCESLLFRSPRLNPKIRFK